MSTVSNLKMSDNKVVLERTFSCAQQLLLQAVLAAFMQNGELLADVVDRAVKAGILRVKEVSEGDEIKTIIGIPNEDEGVQS